MYKLVVRPKFQIRLYDGLTSTAKVIETLSGGNYALVLETYSFLNNKGIRNAAFPPINEAAKILVHEKVGYVFAPDYFKFKRITCRMMRRMDLGQ